MYIYNFIENITQNTTQLKLYYNMCGIKDEYLRSTIIIFILTLLIPEKPE